MGRKKEETYLSLEDFKGRKLNPHWTPFESLLEVAQVASHKLAPRDDDDEKEEEDRCSTNNGETRKNNNVKDEEKEEAPKLTGHHEEQNATMVIPDLIAVKVEEKEEDERIYKCENIAERRVKKEERSELEAMQSEMKKKKTRSRRRRRLFH